MERKYPMKQFFFFVVQNFMFHFFYLFLPGIILCIIGIWSKICLFIGLGFLALDLILSFIEQLRIRKAALSVSDNPVFNELMDAYNGPGGPEAFGEVLERIMKDNNSDDGDGSDLQE